MNLFPNVFGPSPKQSINPALEPSVHPAKRPFAGLPVIIMLIATTPLFLTLVPSYRIIGIFSQASMLAVYFIVLFKLKKISTSLFYVLISLVGLLISVLIWVQVSFGGLTITSTTPASPARTQQPAAVGPVM